MERKTTKGTLAAGGIVLLVAGSALAQDGMGSMMAARMAANPEVAEAFVTFLLSPQGQQLIDRDTVLIPLAPPMEDLSPAAQLLARTTGSFLPIRLGPGLLTFLDEIKRAEFLRSWDATREQQYGP